MYVHLVRHGDVENPERLRYGRLPGFPLSAAGRARVRRTAEHLASISPAVSEVISSPLERARETADIVASILGVETVSVDPRLTEAASPLEGLPRSFAPRPYAQRLLRAADAFANRESPAEVMTRMRAIVADLRARACDAQEERAVVLVSHQAPIQLARRLWELQPADAGEPIGWMVEWWASVTRSRCDYGSVTTLHFDMRAARVASYVEPRGHMATDLAPRGGGKASR